MTLRSTEARSFFSHLYWSLVSPKKPASGQDRLQPTPEWQVGL